MFARRRPLLRAAAVGGGAYVAGKKVAQHSAERTQAEQEQDERISAVEQQQQAPGQPAARQEAGPSVTSQLEQLSALHDQGALSDSEFAAAKSRLLGT